MGKKRGKKTLTYSPDDVHGVVRDYFFYHWLPFSFNGPVVSKLQPKYTIKHKLVKKKAKKKKTLT